MHDSKYRYSRKVAERKELAKSHPELRKSIEASEIRKRLHSQNWQKVDLNELVSRFAPGSTPKDENGKTVFSVPGGAVAVVADIGGGYCRLKRMPQTTKRAQYLDLNGNDPSNFVTETGRVKGRPKPERQAITHFLIKKRNEM